MSCICITHVYHETRYKETIVAKTNYKAHYFKVSL